MQLFLGEKMVEKREHTNKEKRILELIEELNLSQKDFAERVGTNGRTLHNYIHEDRPPNYEILVNMCNVFNVNLNWLLTGFGTMFSDEKKIVALSEQEKELLLYFKNVPDFVKEGLIQGLKTACTKQEAFIEK